MPSIESPSSSKIRNYANIHLAYEKRFTTETKRKHAYDSYHPPARMARRSTKKWMTPPESTSMLQTIQQQYLHEVVLTPPRRKGLAPNEEGIIKGIINLRRDHQKTFL